MAANHFRGPSELPPLPNARPPEPDDPPARAEGMSGFADAADAFRLRFEACTIRTLSDLIPGPLRMMSHSRGTYRMLLFRYR